MTHKVVERFILGILIALAGFMLGVDAVTMVAYWTREELATSLQMAFGLAASGVSLTMFEVWEAIRAALQAGEAERQAKIVSEGLIEAQLLVGSIEANSVTAYKTHLYEPLTSIERLEGVKLLLSTPSYAIPPVPDDGSFDGLSELMRKRLADKTCELILFTPDAHYYHWANILLTDASNIVGSRRDLFLPFCERCKQTLQVALTAGLDPLHKLQVWASHASLMRLTHYSYEGASVDHSTQRQSKSFMVLPDAVTLSTDLFAERGFQSRCFGIPRAWHTVLFDQPGCFFDEFKRCPYSLLSGSASALNSQEIPLLQKDYVLGRTARILFGPRELLREVSILFERFITMRPNEALGLSSFMALTTARATVLLCEIYERSGSVPAQLADRKRIIQECGLFDSPRNLGRSLATWRSKVRELHTSSSFLNSSAELLQAASFNLSNHKLGDAVVRELYLLIAGGFGMSEFVMARLDAGKEVGSGCRAGA